jgi:hypothetical protein
MDAAMSLEDAGECLEAQTMEGFSSEVLLGRPRGEG